MRKITISTGEYYHIYNRGNKKQEIFRENRDWIRFLFCLLHFQSPINFPNISRQISHYVQHRVFNIDKEKLTKIKRQRMVRLVCFCLMPNHFHFLVQQEKDSGIANYLQRLLNSYTKSFNIKYEQGGHLFQGPYRAVHISDNDQLLYTSAYIHRNPKELKPWRDHESNYPWSSYQDYIKGNRWELLLDQEIIGEQFTNGKEYEKWVKSSGAKDPAYANELNL